MMPQHFIAEQTLFFINHNGVDKLDVIIKWLESWSFLKISLLKLGRSKAKPTYNIFNSIGLKRLTRLTLGLNYLNENKFKHNSLDSVNPLCSCSLDTESLPHIFLWRHCFKSICATHFTELQWGDTNIPKHPDNEVVKLLLYVSPKFD